MPDASYDIVSVGSGMAGLTTALFGAMAGLRTVVLEKSALVGGSSCWSHGAIWVGANHYAAAAGIADDRQAAHDYLAFLGGGDHDPARTAALVDNAPRALRLLAEEGIDLRLIDGVSDIMVGRAPGSVPGGRTLEPVPLSGAALGAWRDRLRVPPGDTWRLSITEFVALRRQLRSGVAASAAAAAKDQIGQGAAFVARLMLALQRRDAPILTEHRVCELIVEDGRAAGVVLADGTRIRAERGVMLGTGSYLSDAGLAHAFERLPDYRTWFVEGNDGDGIRLAGDAGGSIGVSRNNRMIMLGYQAPHETSAYYAGESAAVEIPRAHTMVVNAAGQRFGNEALFQEMAPAVRHIDPDTRTYANLPCWLVFDAQYARIWGFSEAPPGAVPDWVHSAPDLATLARAVGIDPAGLKATAARFNRFAQTGVDEDFGRRPAWSATPGGGKGNNGSLGSIAEGPFHAVRLYPTGGASAGVRADPRGRVVAWRGHAVPGLYAAGDVTHHDEFGAGYQAGVTSSTAFTFACLAVEDMRDGP